MAVESITKTLGTGSGIDVSALVTQLVEAQYAAKTEALTAKSEKLTAQISGVSTLKSNMTGFATALAALVNGGSLATQPTSSNTGVLKASALSGAKLANLAATVEVRQIARGQNAVTDVIADPADLGTGKLTLTFGTAEVVEGEMTSFSAGGGTPVEITIDSSNSSLEGIARAINAANAGVTASVITDSSGQRLAIKGGTGASQAFTLTATPDGGSGGLSALNIGVGATGTRIAASAQDAVLVVDGVEMRRASNTILNAIEGVKLELVSASEQPVALGASRPTENLTQAVSNLVDTYNELMGMLKEQTDPVSGLLRADPAAQAMVRALKGLTMTPLDAGATGGTPNTLAAIGVTTNRDGTLSVDSARLSAALRDYPDAVEAMFAPGTGASGAGLSGAVSAIAANVTSMSFGLGASATRYSELQSDLAEQQERLTDQTETTRTRMTQQFASMDAKVAAYKSTQTFLEQQIAAWNAQDD